MEYSEDEGDLKDQIKYEEKIKFSLKDVDKIF